MASDLNEAVRQIVLQEIDSALEPYKRTLQALATLSGVRAGPGRPPGSKNVRRGRRVQAKRRSSGRAVGDASKFSVGQGVRYKQGRGEFDAKILKIDQDANRVTVERSNDGKKVVRPADKVYAA
jgi:sRNA-binding protein